MTLFHGLHGLSIKYYNGCESFLQQLLVRTVSSRLSRIYGSLGDEEQKGHHERLAAAMEEDLELRCGSCNETFGLEPDSLEALPCSHILHAR